MTETTNKVSPLECDVANGSTKVAPPKSPFFVWWCDMLDIHPTIDSRWSAVDVADLAFSAGYNCAMKLNKLKTTIETL